MSGDTRDFNNMEKRAVIKFFFFRKGAKEIHAILAKTLGEHAPSYATVKNWVDQFKRGDFSTCNGCASFWTYNIRNRALLDCGT